MILSALAADGAVSISAICAACGVSSVTARGDLDLLERQGRLKRTRGGAVAVTQFVVPQVPKRMRKNTKAKQDIARYAASLVEDGEMILCGSGSTVLEFLHALGDKRDITIITDDCNGLDYAEAHLPHATVVSTGGTLGREYRHYYGPLVAASLANVLVDKLFMGADGFEPGFGFLAEFERTASTKVEFMRHARNRIILMDSTKVGAARSFVRFARPDEVDMVVMDRDPEGAVAKATRTPDGRIKVVEAGLEG